MMPCESKPACNCPSSGPGRWPTQRWEGLCRYRPSANRRELPTVAIVGSFEGPSPNALVFHVRQLSGEEVEEPDVRGSEVGGEGV